MLYSDGVDGSGAILEKCPCTKNCYFYVSTPRQVVVCKSCLPPPSKRAREHPQFETLQLFPQRKHDVKNSGGRKQATVLHWSSSYVGVHTVLRMMDGPTDGRLADAGSSHLVVTSVGRRWWTNCLLKRGLTGTTHALPPPARLPACLCGGDALPLYNYSSFVD